MSCASAKHRDHLKDITMMPRPKHLPVEIWMPIARAHDHRRYLRLRHISHTNIVARRNLWPCPFHISVNLM